MFSPSTGVAGRMRKSIRLAYDSMTAAIEPDRLGEPLQLVLDRPRDLNSR
jgi:hypothetical protein